MAADVTSEQKATEKPGRFAPGRVVAGKYLVERELASGGVGVVVLATHLDLDQKVAIKYLHPKLLRDAAVVERFKREARLAASIRSEHVVRVHDVGTLDDDGDGNGAPYMVMEYLEGEDLGAVLARGPALAIEVAVDYVLQACEALAEAHAMGIVHRDLKPENLFLTRRSGGSGNGGPASSIVKVVDFGISKIAANGKLGVRLPRITTDNDRFGTPLYMSPEQLASSTNVDARSDIWALGIVLYELLTTQLPFEGDDLPTLLSNVLRSSPIPLRVKRPDAHPELEALLLSCLSRDPSLRPASAAELSMSLAPFGPPSSSSQRMRAVATLPETQVFGAASQSGALPTPGLAWGPSRLTPVPHNITPMPPAPPPRLLHRGILIAATVGFALVTTLAGYAVSQRIPARGATAAAAAAGQRGQGIVATQVPSERTLSLQMPPATSSAGPLAATAAPSSPASTFTRIEPLPSSTSTSTAPKSAAPPPVVVAPPKASATPAPPARPTPTAADYNEFGGRQ